MMMMMACHIEHDKAWNGIYCGLVPAVGFGRGILNMRI